MTTRFAPRFICAALALGCALQAKAEPYHPSNRPSADSAYASLLIVGGSLLLSAGVAEYVLESMQASGQGAVLILKSVADGSRLTLQASAKVARELSLATGASVQVAATSGGYALLASGRLLAWILNEAGQSLMHHSSTREK